MTVNKITINGITFEVKGNHVSVRNGVLYVDGIAVTSGLSGDVHIIWDGDLAQLDAGGSVNCHDVHGNLNVGGAVRCNNISGSVTAGGSVKTSGFGGSARASAAASEHSGNVSVNASEAGYSVRIRHGDIMCGGSVHVRSRNGGYGGNINAGGSVHLE